MTRRPKDCLIGFIFIFCLTGFNGEALPGGVPRPEGGRWRKSMPTVLGSGLYAFLTGDGQARSPKKVRLVNAGSDRSPGRGDAG